MDVDCPLLTDCLTLGKTRLLWLILREFTMKLIDFIEEKVRKQTWIGGFHLRTPFSLFDGVWGGLVSLVFFRRNQKYLKKTQFDYFFLPMPMSALWQRIPEDQCLTCSPGSFNIPKFSQSKPMTDTPPDAGQDLLRVNLLPQQEKFPFRDPSLEDAPSCYQELSLE